MRRAVAEHATASTAIDTHPRVELLADVGDELAHRGFVVTGGRQLVRVLLDDLLHVGDPLRGEPAGEAVARHRGHDRRQHGRGHEGQQDPTEQTPAVLAAPPRGAHPDPSSLST